MSADGCPYATRQRLALECALFEPFQKFVFDETPQPTLAFSKRVSRNVAQTCPTHEGPAVHLDKSGGLFRIQDANSASIGICAWRQNGAISRILLNRRSFHRCTPGLPGRDRKIMFPAWITFLVLVQSKDNTGVFRVVMTGYCHESFLPRSPQQRIRRAMNEIDLRLMRAAVAIADDLNFSRAAARLHISQPALTKQIQDLEGFLRTSVFERDHQKVSLTDAGRAFVEGARLSLAHHQRAIQAARSVAGGAEAVLNLGLSPYIDTLLTSIVSTVQLPLFPDLQLHFSSDYSLELVRKVDSGELDIAVVVEGTEQRRLASVELTQAPFYVLMQEGSLLTRYASISIKSLDGVPWILFAPQVHPFLYEQLRQRADGLGVVPTERHHVTNAEHAAQLVNRTGGVAFLTRHGASRVAFDGLTLRPLVEPDIRLRIVMVARNDAVGVVSEFVRATVKRVKKLTEPTQGRLPLAI